MWNYRQFQADFSNKKEITIRSWQELELLAKTGCWSKVLKGGVVKKQIESGP